MFLWLFKLLDILYGRSLFVFYGFLYYFGFFVRREKYIRKLGGIVL